MPNMFDYNPGVDALQSFGQIGPHVRNAQVQGMRLGLERQRLLMDYALRQQEAQRQLQHLQLAIQQAQALQQFRQGEQSYHDQQLGEARKAHNQQMNEFAIKYHQNVMKSDEAKRGTYKPYPGAPGVLYNEKTGDFKKADPSIFGGVGAVKESPINPQAIVGSENTLANYGMQHPEVINKTIGGTNSPAFNPGIASQYQQATNIQALANRLLQQKLQGLVGQGQPQLGSPATPSPATKRFRIIQVQ